VKRWLPHIHFGGTSGECISDKAEGGREGYYFEVCWFGFKAEVSLSSVYAERRRSARAHKRYSGISK